MPKKNIKKLIIIIALFAVLAIFNPVLAQTYNFANNSGLNKAGDTAGYDTGSSATPVEGVISQVLYTVLGLVGIIFFGYLVYGGYIWMTARGNEERVRQATDTLINSIIGLVVTLGAYTISYYLISYFRP